MSRFQLLALLPLLLAPLAACSPITLVIQDESGQKTTQDFPINLTGETVTCVKVVTSSLKKVNPYGSPFTVNDSMVGGGEVAPVITSVATALRPRGASRWEPGTWRSLSAAEGAGVLITCGAAAAAARAISAVALAPLTVAAVVAAARSSTPTNSSMSRPVGGGLSWEEAAVARRVAPRGMRITRAAPVPWAQGATATRPVEVLASTVARYSGHMRALAAAMEEAAPLPRRAARRVTSTTAAVSVPAHGRPPRPSRPRLALAAREGATPVWSS